MKSFKTDIVMVALLAMAALGFMSCHSSSAKLVSITITPADQVSVHGAATGYQFTAIGTFSDGKVLNYTSEVTWSSSEPAVATVGTTAGVTGYVTVLSVGATTITAVEPYTHLSGSALLSIVTPSTLTITPENPVMTTGKSHQFTAIASYLTSSGTATQSLLSSAPSKTWSSSNPLVATVSNGLVTTLASSGTTTITVQDLDSPVFGTTMLLVTTGTLSFITVTPVSADISISSSPGLSRQLTATGTYDDATILDLTEHVNWYSAATGTVVVGNITGSKGLATAATLTSFGTATITATDPISSITGTASVTVTP